MKIEGMAYPMRWEQMWNPSIEEDRIATLDIRVSLSLEDSERLGTHYWSEAKTIPFKVTLEWD